MTELEQALEQFKKLLEDAGNPKASAVKNMSDEELGNLLRRFKREIKRRESAYSPNSEEYINLSKQRKLAEQIERLLRDLKKENSGLMLMKEKEKQSTSGGENNDYEEDGRFRNLREKEKYEKDKIKNDIEKKHKLYKYAKARNNRTGMSEMQKIYREAVKLSEKNSHYIHLLALLEQENGNSRRREVQLTKHAFEAGSSGAAGKLAVIYQQGKKIPQDLEKARECTDEAVERENVKAIRLKALGLIGNNNYFQYGKNEEEAFRLFKRYIELRRPLDMEDKMDRECLYFYYYVGARCGHDMEKEALPESWKSLIETEGIYSKEAGQIVGFILAGQGKYQAAVKKFLDTGTVDAIQEVESLFFHKFFDDNPNLRQDIEKYLESILKNSQTAVEIRKELYRWYAWRYETGTGKPKRDVIAYAYYEKAAIMEGKGANKDYRKRFLRGFTDAQEIVFYRSVLEQCLPDDTYYNDVLLDMGQVYEGNSQLADAIQMYQQGAEVALSEEVRKLCNEGEQRCQAVIAGRRVQEEEAKASINQCESNTPGVKKIGFERLWEMANKGNTYAAYYFAYFAENDAWIKDYVKKFPSTQEIFNGYKKAAEAGWSEAIVRMADIYEYGQLGQRRDVSQAERWRNKL